MLKIQEYLQTHTFADLEAEFHINVKDYENDAINPSPYVVLNYDQIESPKYNEIVKECRGLILHKHDHHVVARAFDRFYKYGEDQANDKTFEVNKSFVYEKIDGSLCLVWYDFVRNTWNMSTRGMAFGEGLTGINNTFRSVFDKSINNRDINTVFKDCNSSYTFIFELTSPETRVVKPYPVYGLYLLAHRNNITGEETIDSNELDELAKSLGVLRPQLYRFDNIADCAKMAERLHTFDEGFVCTYYDEVKGIVRRIKVKNPAYLAIHNLRTNGCISEKRICSLVWSNDYDEYLNYFPEDKQFFDPYIKAKDLIYKEIQDVWSVTKDIPEQKDFALTIKDVDCKSILFSIRSGKTISDIISELSDSYKETLLNKYVTKHHLK